MLATCIYHRAEKSWRTAAILALAVTGASWGQVFQEREGRALDANPLVGSGGSNTPVRGYVPINGNQVMTGNVTGLGYFHGRVPYSSTTEFNGRLGSADLRDFARRSAGAPGGSTYTGGYSTYYLPSQTVSTAQGRINPGSLSGMEARLVGPAAINPTSSARPMSGFGQNTLVPVPPQTEATVPLRSYRPSASYDATGSSDTSSLFGWRNPKQEGQALNADLEASIRPAARAGEEDFVARPGQKPADAVKDNQKDNAGDNDKTKDKNDDTPGGMGRVGSEVDGRLKPVMPVETAKPERNLDGSLKATREGKASDIRPGTKETKTAETPSRSDSPAVALVRAELAKYQSTDPSQPNYRSKQWIDNRIREAQSQSYLTSSAALPKGDAKSEVPAAKRAPAREPASVNDVMNIADAQMRAGRYIQAANTYQSVLMLDAGYTPAMLSRAHAEIAAGFYESAAYDLRFLYERYPDLATLKVDLRRIMGDRVDYVIDDLSALSKRSPKGPAGMLLAYCYYQTGQQDKLKEHIKAWGEASPGDRWQQLAATQWAGMKKSEAGQK